MKALGAGAAFAAGLILLLPSECTFEPVAGGVQSRCPSYVGLAYSSPRLGLWIALALSFLLAVLVYNLLGIFDAVRVESHPRFR